MPRRKQRYSVSWIESHTCYGIVYATSETDAKRKVRAGEAAALRQRDTKYGTPMVHGVTPASNGTSLLT